MNCLQPDDVRHYFKAEVDDVFMHNVAHPGEGVLRYR